METTVIEATPFYTNWTFWTFIVAALAIVLSQLPAVRLWFKRAKIEIEVHSRINISHRIGNPNAQIYVIVSNMGGRSVRIRSIALDFTRDSDHIFTLPVQNYYETTSSTDPVLFAPFLLHPDEDWSHGVNFLNFFNRADEKRYRNAESNLRLNINGKVPPNPPTSLIEADQEAVEPLLEFFNEKFDWLDGEYEVTLRVEGDKTSSARKYRFTIFETESEELRAAADRYRYGEGVYWDQPGGRSLGIQLNEAEA